jgi:flagella basal body P-ring formation protein FlgA
LPATAAPTTAHRRQAEQKLVAAFQQQYRPADASLGALLVRFEVPDDAVAATLRAAPHQLAFRDVEVRQGGPQVLTVVCTSDEASVAAEWGVRAWVTTPPQVLAVRHAVPKGVVLQPGDLVWQPLGDGEPAGLQQLQQAVGKEATRSLRPGQRLLASDLADVPLVRAQDIVTGLVRRPGLTVKRQFKAVTAGALYEPVQLVALDDPRLKLQGVVSGYHEVTLFSSDELPRPVDAGGPKGALP